MHQVALTLPIPPSVNAYWIRTPSGMAPSKIAKTYKKLVGKLLLGATSGVLLGPLTITVTVYRPQRRGDLDNFLKGLLDACNGEVWRDDEQIINLFAHRRDDPSNPRVELVVETVAAQAELGVREKKTRSIGSARLLPAVVRNG